MRFLSLALMLGAALLIGACGDKADTGGTDAGDSSDAGKPDTPAKVGIALAGEGWDGGAGIDPMAKSDKVRVIQFFKPG